MKLIDEIEALKDKATQGSWKTAKFSGRLPSIANSNGQHQSEHASAHDAEYIVALANGFPSLAAKIRAAEELASVVRKIEALPNRFQIMEQITPGLELELFNRLSYFDRSGSEERK